MPEYSFKCDKCDTAFGKIWSMSDYEQKIQNVRCPCCRACRVYRDYGEDAVITNYIKGLHEVSTIGEYADKQTKKYGKDKCEKMVHDFSPYRRNKDGGMKELPSGMTRMDKPEDMPKPLTKKAAKAKRKGKRT